MRGGCAAARVAVLGGLLASVTTPLAAQSSSRVSHTWQIEAVGGVSGLSPDDLNARVAYDTTVVDYLRLATIEQDHEGVLVELDQAGTFAVRALRRLTPGWSVGAGFARLSTRQTSSIRASYRYSLIDPRAQEFEREFSQTLSVDPLVLEATEYVPQGLVRYDRPVSGRLRIGATLQAGWTLADCRVQSASRTQGGSYPRDRQVEVSMTGSGGGFAADALASGGLMLTSRVAVVVEGGYAWHRVKTITGTLTTTTRVQDGEATELELDQAVETTGRWINAPATVQTSAGAWQGTVPSIGSAGAPFTLDLSGWTVRVGVSFGF